MFTFKRFAIFVTLAVFSVNALMGQRSNREMTVEESYLQESIELMIIRETSRAESMDQKMVALEYIGDAIDRGNTGDEIRQVLEFLSLEGILNKTMETGRVVNTHPLVRRQSARYLGQLGTEEATRSLLKIGLAENEPMVLQEVVKSLGDIGIDKNGETISTISWIVTRFDVLNPDNLLALSAVDAIEKIAEKNDGISDPNVIRLLIRIAEGPYIRPVQERARQLIFNLRGF
jgi:hypothetical protein